MATHRKIWILALVAVIGLLATACGGGNDNAEGGDGGGGVTVSPTGADGGSATPAATSTEPVTVNVTLGEYSIESSVTTFQVGVPYHFVVDNPGEEEHEFMIVEPIAAGTMDMEEMDAMAVGHIEEDDLQAGDTATVDVTFDKAYPPGTLEMACHIKQHYEKGMVLPIVVE